MDENRPPESAPNSLDTSSDALRENGLPPIEPARSITDSPWFWVILFGAAALVGLVAIAPKHAQRQARLERKNDTRDLIARRKSEQAEAPAGDRAASIARPESTTLPESAALPESTAEDPDAATTKFVARTGQRSESVRALLTFLAILLAVTAASVGIVNYLRIASRRAERGQGQEINR